MARPIGIGIHSYVASVVLMALDRPLFFGGHFISLVRTEIPNLMLRRGGGGALSGEKWTGLSGDRKNPGSFVSRVRRLEERQRGRERLTDPCAADHQACWSNSVHPSLPTLFRQT